MINHNLRYFLTVALLSSHSYLSNAYESSLTLPKGLSRARNVSVFTMPVVDSYNSNGKLVSVADPMTQSIKGSRIVSEKLAATDSSDPKYQDYLQLNAVIQGMNKISPSQDLGELFQVDISGNTKVSAQRYFFGYEYGLSDTLSIGFSLPIVHYDIEANVQAKLKSNGAAIQQLQSVQDFGPAVNEAVEKIEASASEIEAGVIKAAFEDKGYQRPSSFSYTALGEAEFGAKKSWMRNKLNAFSTQISLRAPTATHSKDYTNILDPGAGDGQWDFYGVAAYDFHPNRNLRLGTGARYTFQLPDSHYMPIQRKGEEGLPDLNDDYVWDNVNRDLGDTLDIELSSHYSFWRKRFELSALYLYYYKGADSIQGGKQLDYASISQNTETTSHSYELGLKFSTIEDVLNNRAKIPVDVRIAFNDTFAGKNAFDAQFYRLDLALYFK